ncbi:MAG: efflux transporter outer membrane subunit [Gemmatimonadales bacterium]
MTMRLASLTLAAALTGCAIGPSTRVKTPAPRPVALRDTLVAPSSRGFLDSLARARDSLRADTAAPTLWKPATLALDSTADLPWLEVLKDPALVELVRTALANNRDLQAAVARVREYRASLGASRGNLFPQLTGNATYSTNQSIFGAFPPQTFDAVRITADLSWELDFWGRLRRQSEAAKFDWQGRDEDRRAAVLSLVSSVAQTYLQLRELDQSTRLTEQTLASRQQTLELSRRRFSQGVISELDVRQFEAAAAAPAATLATIARQRAQTENQLSLLLGQQPGPITRGHSLEEAVQAIQVPDSVSGDLLLRRPDVLSAQRDWQGATARVGVAVGNRLPRFVVTGTYGTQRPDFNRLFTSNAEVYQLAGGISIPLFTGGRLVNEQRAARARAEQARARYEQAVLSAAREASDALAGLRLSRDQLAAQETQTQALRRAFALAEKRYESGISSYLEVLDAQRGLFAAELQLVQVERQYLSATVQLYRALGGSWE